MRRTKLQVWRKAGNGLLFAFHPIAEQLSPRPAAVFPLQAGRYTDGGSGGTKGGTRMTKGIDETANLTIAKTGIAHGAGNTDFILCAIPILSDTRIRRDIGGRECSQRENCLPTITSMKPRKSDGR